MPSVKNIGLFPQIPPVKQQSGEIIRNPDDFITPSKDFSYLFNRDFSNHVGLGLTIAPKLDNHEECSVKKEVKPEPQEGIDSEMKSRLDALREQAITLFQKATELEPEDNAAFRADIINRAMNGESAKLYASYESLPEHRKPEFIAMAEDFAQNARATRESAYTPPPLPDKAPVLFHDAFPPYSRISKDELKAFVLDTYGPWLAAVHPEIKIDAITRDELRERDKTLMNKLEKTFSPDELVNIVQHYSIKAKNEALEFSKDQIRKAEKARTYQRIHKLLSL